MIRGRVAVVGGGLAGITAALALQESGAEVDVYEARPWLGGATHSFERDGLLVDNGQHVFLRCCDAYQGLLRRLGVQNRVSIQDRLDICVLGPDGRRSRLRRGKLPAPVHLLPALAGYDLLPWPDRLRSVRASLAFGGLDPSSPALDAQSVGAWLDAHGQRKVAKDALWELFLLAALNARLDDAALGPAAMVIKTALLGRPDAADIGVPTVPLRHLHGVPARDRIEARGGRVHLKARVREVRPDAVVLDDDTRPADAVVVAVPHDQAATVLPPRVVGAGWAALDASPILNVHVIYDRPVMDRPFMAAVDSPVQWVFERSTISGLRHGQYLAVSVSGADELINTSVAELRAVFLPELERLFPSARNARVIESFVTRERRATFRQAPGSGALRPRAATGLPGLYLAGAWTDTGWPDTMEGAVRSGLNAAGLVRRYLTRQHAEVVR